MFLMTFRFIDLLTSVARINYDVAADASAVYSYAEVLDRGGAAEEAGMIRDIMNRIDLKRITKEEMFDVGVEIRGGDYEAARRVAEPRMRELPDHETNVREITVSLAERKSND